MRKFSLCILILLTCLLGTGCGQEGADPNLLTNIFAPVFPEIAVENATSVSQIQQTEKGYRYAISCDNARTRVGDEPIVQTYTIYDTDEDGVITRETPVDPDYTSYNAITSGQRGMYTIILENRDYVLCHLDWEGNVVSKVSCGDIRPKGGTNTPETANLMGGYPLVETDEGLALCWGKICLLLNESLALTGEIPLPGTGQNVYFEDGTLWLVYEEGGGRALGQVKDGEITASYPFPEGLEGVSRYYWAKPIACEDGWLYGWNNTTGVVRWQFAAEEETVEQVISFANSCISGQSVRSVSRLSEKLYSVSTSAPDGTGVKLCLYEKAPDKDLSQMTVLTLACISPTTGLEELVFAFNAVHPDTYIRIVTYEQYNTAENPIGGYDRLEMDLTTGLLQADILLNQVFQPLDLYPLMTGNVGQEDLAPCVRNQYEEDGKLYQIGSRFSVDVVAGRRDALGGMTGWTMEEFLTYAESLPEGEYLMEEVSRDTAGRMLFGSNQYAPFIQDGTASFENPLYLRYLTLLHSLPEESQQYMNHGKNNSAALLAGEITEDQLEIEEGGENLYYNGKIKLARQGSVSSPDALLNLAETFGTSDLTLIGVPSEEGSGLQVRFQDFYCIPATCQNPALAWEFLESALFTEDALPDAASMGWQDLRNHCCFRTLYQPYLDWTQTLEGYKMFQGLTYGGKQYGFDIALDENGQYGGQPGILTTVDEGLLGLIAEIYETAGDTTHVPYEILEIAREEESRYLAGAISAEECARIVQSRVGIWLAENS